MSIHVWTCKESGVRRTKAWVLDTENRSVEDKKMYDHSKPRLYLPLCQKVTNIDANEGDKLLEYRVANGPPRVLAILDNARFQQQK